jgi:Spy/CpxP family protein refolding chaperone
MRALWLVLVLPALLVSAALAEKAEKPSDIVPDRVTVQLMLLRQTSVQKELKITPELAKKVLDFTNMEHEAYLKSLKLGEEAREAKHKELHKANEAFLTENLSKEQHKRLGQITMQVTGLHQLMRPEVAKLLELTEEQKEKVKKMHDAAKKAYTEIVDADKVENQDEKLAELRAKIHDEIMALLTEKQKEIAKEIVGERFKGAILIEQEPKDK